MLNNILDQIRNNNNQENNKETPTPEASEDIVSKTDRMLNDILGEPVSQGIGRQEFSGFVKPDQSVNLSEENTLKNEDLTQAHSESMLNSLKTAWDSTQKSSYQSKVNDNQLIIDNNENLREDWIKARRLGKIDDAKLNEITSKIDEENAAAEKERDDAKEGVETNAQEIESEYVSKAYRLNEALVNSKGAKAGIGEAMSYTFSSGVGSMGAMAAQQLVATFGKKAIDKIAAAAVTGAAEGLMGGPAAEITVPVTAALTAATQIALLWSARHGETMSEKGDNVENAKNKLTQNWFEKYNPTGDPNGPQPSEYDLRQIRIQSMKGIDDLEKENMSLLAMDGIEMMIGSSLFKGSSFFKGAERLGGYNKYSRLGKTAGFAYLGGTGEKLEEGLQYAAGQRQFDKALNLNQYEDKGFMQNLLTDSEDTFKSINYSLPYMGSGESNMGGRYSENEEFQAAAEAGGLLGMIGSGIGASVRIAKDINTYVQTSKDLKTGGIANVDEKIFKLKDELYKKHFENGTVNFLLEGVRNLKDNKDEKGQPLMSDEQAGEEVNNIINAYNKYKEVEDHLENIDPNGFLGMFTSPEQKVMLAKAKSELFYSTMAIERNSKQLGVVETVENISNLISHQEKIVNAIENTVDDNKLSKTYNLESRLKIARAKLAELNKRKEEILSLNGMSEKDLPESSVDQSNKNKEYLINNVNLSEITAKYNELLKIKDNKTLKAWYDKQVKEKVEKDNAIKQTEETKKREEAAAQFDSESEMNAQMNAEAAASTSEKKKVDKNSVKVGDRVIVTHNGKEQEVTVTDVNHNISFDDNETPVHSVYYRADDTSGKKDLISKEEDDALRGESTDFKMKIIEAPKAVINAVEVVTEVPQGVITKDVSEEIYMYPDTKTGSKSNVERERISGLTKGELLSSDQVQEIIDRSEAKGEDINDIIYIDAVDYTDNKGVVSKSVRIKIGDNVLGYFPNNLDPKSVMYQIINSIKAGTALDNKAVKALGIGINISNGRVAVSEKAVSLASLNDIVKTNGSYVIFDQQTAEAQEAGAEPVMISSAGIKESSEDAVLPQEFKSLGRYILAFKNKSGKRMFIPVSPIEIGQESVNEIFNKLRSISDKVVNKEVTQDEVDKLNKEISDGLFISVSKESIKSMGKGAISVKIGIAPNGDLRAIVSHVEKTPGGKKVVKVDGEVHIKNSDMKTITTSDALLAELTSKLNKKKVSVTLDVKSFRQSISKSFKGDPGTSFQTYTDPKVIDKQDVKITLNQTAAAIKTVDTVTVTPAKSNDIGMFDENGNFVEAPITATPVSTPSSPTTDIKADIEKLKQTPEGKEIENRRSLTTVSDEVADENNYDGYSENSMSPSGSDEWIKTGEWYGTYINKNGEKEQILANSEKELLDTLNAKYDAELAALEGGKTSAKAKQSESVAAEIKTETKAEERARKKAEQINAKPQAPKLDDAGAARMSDGIADELISKEEIEEIEEMIPEGIRIETKKDLRRIIRSTIKNRTVWGAFKKNVIYLWNQSASGTGYHEAFHAVFRYAISDKEVDMYLRIAEKEVIAKYKTAENINKAMDELRASNMDYAELSQNQIYALLLEEHMADRFMAWKKNAKEASKTTKVGLIQLFKRLTRLFNYITGNDKLDAFFGKIDRGAFSSTKAVANKQTLVSETAYKNLMAGENSFIDSTKSKKMINTFAARTKYILSNWNGKGEKPERDEVLEDLIEERIEALETSGYDYIDSLEDKALAIKLEKSIDDELFTLRNEVAKGLLTEQVNKKLDMFKIEKDDVSEEDSKYNDDEKGGETGFGSQESWTISLEESSSKLMREWITFAMYEAIDELTNQKVMVSVDGPTIYNGIGHVLANTDEDKMIEKFIVYAKDNAQAKAVLDMIMSNAQVSYDSQGVMVSKMRNNNDLRMFITAFKNAKVTFLHTEFMPRYDFSTGLLTSNKVKTYNANINTAEKISLQKWANSLINIRNNNQTDRAFWTERVNNVIDEFNENKDVLISDEQLDAQIVKVQDAFRMLGFDFSSGYLRYSLLKSKTKISESQKNDMDMFGDREPLDISFLKADSSGMTFLNLVSNNKDPYDKQGFGIRATISKYAVANGMFDESLAASNFKGSDNNTRHDIIKPSYVLDEALKIKNNPSYREFLKNKYEILKDNILFKDDSTLNGLVINLIDGIRDHTRSTNEGKVFGDFSEREYLLQHLGFWFSQTKGMVETLFRQNEASNTAYTSTMKIRNFIGEDGEVNTQGVDTVYSFFEGEYNRIARESKSGLGNVKGYNDSKTGRAFRFTEFSNMLSVVGPEKYNEITESARKGKEISEELKAEIKEALKKSLTSQIVAFKKMLANNKLISLKDGKLESNYALPTHLLDKDAALSKEELDQQLKEMYINDYVNSFSLNQLFDGDYALSRDDKGVKKYSDGSLMKYTFVNGKLAEAKQDDATAIEVEAPKQELAIDIVKRHKGAMGSGSDLGKGEHVIAFIKDINVYVEKLPVNGQLVRTDKKDGTSKINSNDAQSLSSINHIIFMAKRLGRRTNEIRAILNKVRRGIEINAKEQEALESAQVSLNPWKTVTFGREFYIKTSESIIHRHEVSHVDNQAEYDKLMDELEKAELNEDFSREDLIKINKKLVALYSPIKGKEQLHKILNQMDINGIDQVVAESASKGYTLTPQDSLSKDLDLSKSMIKIPNRYKRLQVETPTGKNVITSGTQLMQLIDSEQNDLFEVTLPDGSVQTLRDIRLSYRSNMAKTRDNSFKMAQSYIKNISGKVREAGDSEAIDTSKLKVKFLKALEASGADEQLLQIFELNWNLLPAIDKAEQLFLAHFGSGVLSQKVPGTKVSLVSDAHTFVVVDKNNKVIMNKTVKANRGAYDGNKVRKLLHNVKDPVTGQVYSECILSEKVFSKFGLKIGDEIPVDVATMLGYRIPTQDKSFMTSLRVVDVMPNYAEGSGIFPAELVLLSGADFDIDSLFIQQPSFWMKDGKAIKAGTETTLDDKWSSYKSYLEKNKLFKAELIDRKINSLVYSTLKATKNKTEEQKKALRKIDNDITIETMKFFGLPSNKNEYALTSGLNNDALNNDILDQQLIMLTNKGLEDIQLTSVSSESLENVAKVIQTLKGTYNEIEQSSSSLLGMIKSFVQNSAGKAGIGPSANAIQAFAFLAKNDIGRIGRFLSVNGQELQKFSYINKSKKRIADVLSSVLSIMTDNAKDPIAGKIGLSLEILSPFNYMLSLGVSEEDAAVIINAPSIQAYAQMLKENKYGIKTQAEEKGSRDIKMQAILQEIVGTEEKVNLNRLIKMYKYSDVNTENIKDLIQNGVNDNNRDVNIMAFVKFLQIEEEAKSFQYLNNLIKLTKGLPTSFTDAEKSIKDSLDGLMLSGMFGLEQINEKNPAFILHGAILEDKLLMENIKKALLILDHSEAIFVSETKPFKAALKTLMANLRPGLKNDEIREIKRTFLGFVTTRAYVKWMKEKKRGNPDFNPSNDSLLFSEFKEKTLAKQLIEMQNSTNPRISNNAFVKWLRPEIKFNEEGIEVDGKIEFDRVSGKSFIKLSAESINDIVNSFQDLYMNEETRDFAVNCFQYLITKDNLEFKNDSFVKYISPFMFENVSVGLDNVLSNLINKTDENGFNSESEEFRKILNSYLPTQKRFTRKMPQEAFGIKAFVEKDSKEYGAVTLENGKVTFSVNNENGNESFDKVKHMNEMRFESKDMMPGEEPTKAEKVKEIKVEEKAEVKIEDEESLIKILDDIKLFETKDVNEAKEFITNVFNSISTIKDAKRAYRTLSFKFHPDKNNSVEAEEIFKFLNNTNESFREGDKKQAFGSDSFWTSFDAKSFGTRKHFKFPEFIVIKIGKVSKLFKTDIGTYTEKWALTAEYNEVEFFGYDTVSPFSKQSYNEAIASWHIIKNIKASRAEKAAQKEDFGPAVTKIGKATNAPKSAQSLDAIEEALKKGESFMTKEEGGNDQLKKSDKIVFGHPTIGKSFLKKDGDNRFISLDDDYSTEINNKVNKIAETYKVTPYQVKDGGSQVWNKEYNTIMQELFDVAKQKAISENKILFTSNTELLKNNLDSFDKVINLTDAEFERRIQERGAKYDTKNWKDQINKVISKVDPNKIITTNKYLSDFMTKEEKGETQTSTSVKEGVSELFESNPELAKLGTIEQYSQYLDTIFPDSQVKDIVYHGTDAEFDKFDFTKEGKRNKGQGLYFSVFKKAAENYGKNIIPSLLNSKSIKEVNITRGQNYGDIGKVFKNSNYDTVYGFSDLNRNKEFNDIYNSEYVVFEPEQIHILGSKQDIEGFKEFVTQPSTSVKESTEKLQESEKKTILVGNPKFDKQKEELLMDVS